MSMSNDIEPHVPYLRRFARALLGSQASGDDSVAATLEAILADRSLFVASLGPRVALSRAFLRSCKDLGAARTRLERLTPEEAAAARNLASLPSAPRIAFLLSALESFTSDEIALALDCRNSEVQDLLDAANRQLARQIRTNVLIIEDEPLIALDLQTLVEQLGHHVVEPIARTHVQAVRQAKSNPPGVILADIQLADGSSGLDAVNEILQNFAAPVIFITAFPQRLLTGQAPEPAFLITKPYSAEAVQAAISQALFFDQKSKPVRSLAACGD